MAKAIHPALGRLKNLNVCFQGRFPGSEDRHLSVMIKAHGGTVATTLDKKVTHCILPDLASGAAAQKKVAALRKQGAAIEVVAADAFRDDVRLTDEELIAILKDVSRSKPVLNAALILPAGDHHLKGAKLDNLDLSGLTLRWITFEKCSFVGAKLNDTRFDKAIGCDFSKATAENARFGNIDCSRFAQAQLKGAEFCTHLQGSDFTGAQLQNTSFSESFWASAVTKRPSKEGPIFALADLTDAYFEGVQIEGADFREAKLRGAAFKNCRLDRAAFRNANAQATLFVACDLPKADFSKASFAGSNFAEADLTGATFDDADFTGANLRGAKIKASELKRLKGADAGATKVGAIGPALKELDGIFKKSKQVVISFVVGVDGTGPEYTLQITAYSTFASLWLADAGRKIAPYPLGSVAFSEKMLQAGRVFGHLPVRFETLRVESTKAPKSGKSLRDLVIQGISEAFAQPAPSEYDAKAAAEFRDKQHAAAAKKKKDRADAQAAQAKKQEVAKKQIAKNVAKVVGKVNDVPTFLKALELRIDWAKIDKAAKMLKASKFKLFHDVEESRVTGVVKSQTDPDLVYACRLTSEGQYCCCTQNLAVCGGLKGSICKHLLVLIIGLVQAGELDPSAIDDWIAKSVGTKAAFDKEALGEVFLKYKGAEAGEVDWRPTETIPEDFYAM